MLENVDLAKSLPKEEYRGRLASDRRRLFDLQKACRDAAVGSVVVFEGWDAAGKGSVINALTRQLEPRGFRLHSVQAPRSRERELPWLWRFWNMLPNHGEIAIFDQSWYRHVSTDRQEPWAGDAARALLDISEFERTLSDDGYVLTKFFLHLGRGEQGKRLKQLAKDPLCAWQVDDRVWERHRHYEEQLRATEAMLAASESGWAPWTIVEATDHRWATIRVFEGFIGRLEAGLAARGVPLPATMAPVPDGE